MSNFVNSKDPDEMQHDAAFHLGLHCFFKGKKSFLNYNLTPLDMYNGLSEICCIKTRRKNPFV